jgi:hypothetical protein
VADEPTTEAEVAKPVAPPPAVGTIAAAVALINEGRSEDAITALRHIRASTAPRNPYVMYLLGNLYFEKRWWTVGIDHYRDAIRENRVYRKKPILNKNVIRALGSAKTRPKATKMLVDTIGSPALPFLRRAAKSDPSAEVRKHAASIERRLNKPAARRSR